MSQHDYDLANAAGASFRADANLALTAIVSNNSGAAEPTTKFAYMWWADTATGMLKIRNSANAARKSRNPCNACIAAGAASSST